LTEHLLDINTYTEPVLGDEVVAYGAGDWADVWAGVVAKEPNHITCTEPYVPWSAHARSCYDEYVVTSHQHQGQSGCAVASGCGYLGMAHVAVTTAVNSTLASIITAKTITSFIRSNYDKLKTWEECDKKAILKLPIVPFMECNIIYPSSSQQ